MNPNDDQGGIEHLHDQLYSRDHAPKQRERRHLRPDTKPVPESWETVEDAERIQFMARQKKPKKRKPDTQEIRQKRNQSILTLILAASFLFFSVSAVIAGYMFYVGNKPISPENIDIEISGPLAVPGGEELSLQLSIVNRNAAPIQGANLIIDYPEGTRSADGNQRDISRVREDLGEIPSGRNKNLTVRSIHFGPEDSEQQITVALEYRVEGSNAIFFKERTYTVVISSAPVALTVESLREISSGEEIAFRVRAVSNSSSLLRNVLVTAEYPPGFTFTGAEPAPASGTSLWRIGDLRAGEAREFTIRGTLAGQDGEQRVFRFATGITESSEDNTLATVFTRSESTIAIKRPFLQAALAINGQTGTGDVAVSQSQPVNVTIDLANMLPDAVRDIEVTARLRGEALNTRAITTRDGFYRSQDTSVVWNRETARLLDTMRAGERGQLTFAFQSLPIDSIASVRNGEVTIELSVRGRRVSEAQVPETIETTVTRKVLVGTNASISGSTLHSVGPFENIGPVPPQVETRTTYTLQLRVANTANEMRDVVVRTTLPWYVEWLGLVSPQGADLSYNEVSGDLVWRVGTVPAGAGYDRGTVDVAFQVAIEPSFGQRGQSPTLLGEQVLTGIDSFTGGTVEARRQALTTRLLDDPEFAQAQNSGVVVE